MTTDTRQLGGQDYGIPPIEQRSSTQRPTMRPAPNAIAATQGDAAAADDDDGVVILSKPYLAYDVDVSRIKLRRPLTREIKKCGNPLKLTTGADGRVTDIDVRWDVIAAYIPLLASPPLPQSTVDQFEFVDLDACAAVIASFFARFR